MSRKSDKAALWLSKIDLEYLFEQSQQKANFADLLLEDFCSDIPVYSPKAKLLLRELYSLVEGNLGFYKDSLTKNLYEKDGVAGYVVTESDLLGVTAYGMNLKKISLELLELGYSLELQ